MAMLDSNRGDLSEVDPAAWSPSPRYSSMGDTKQEISDGGGVIEMDEGFTRLHFSFLLAGLVS